MPLIKVLAFLKSGNADVVQRYLRYKTNVCRQVYADQELADWRLPEHEAAWPQYKESKILISRPSYLAASDGNIDSNVALALVNSLSTLTMLDMKRNKKGQVWLQHFLGHIQHIQELKQHHVHLPDDKVEKVLLTH